jgi:selenide,water dikinase
MSEVSEIRLTQYSKGSGCGCKIEPAVLEKILNKTQKGDDFKKLLGGYETNDDAAVWDCGNGMLLLSTTDFFTPIVDDPFDFGRISATNAISDIYAMGGTPSFALAILGFPVDKLPVEVAAEMMRGARVICADANIPLAGGHSIDIPEPVFGLVVNGFVGEKNLRRNNTANEGDLLFMTKPVGTGIISSAQKRGKADPADVRIAVEQMTSLNSIGAELSKLDGVHAMTDITGFGLLGHLIEMCEGSGLSAELNYNSIPLIPGIEKYTAQFIFPDNVYRNWNAYEKKVSGVNGPEFITLCDPQTSGGLLIAVDPSAVNQLLNVFKKFLLDEFTTPVGVITRQNNNIVTILP